MSIWMAQVPCAGQRVSQNMPLIWEIGQQTDVCQGSHVVAGPSKESVCTAKARPVQGIGDVCGVSREESFLGEGAQAVGTDRAGRSGPSSYARAQPWAAQICTAVEGGADPSSPIGGAAALTGVREKVSPGAEVT